ncbi:MAG: AAA family ATPase [Pirellulales bacterium]
MSTATALVRAASVVDLMNNPSSYPEHPSSVQLIETHISWVFLTDRNAYKLKKPVRFEFLDFSTAELRHRACQEELRLNRRLAPDVYIDVLPITQDPSGLLELNGRGQEVDWVVKMLRLPAHTALDIILSENRLRPEDSEDIAKHLINFYAGLLPKPLSSDDYRQALDRHIRANGMALLESLPAERARLRRIQSAQLRYLNVRTELIDKRVATGRIVDGHGDLRPEHIYLDGHPIVIDCIEFSDELRTVDIADELSFLSMECRRLGDGRVGEVVISQYQRVCKDEIPETLLAFYAGYRALVRAKVALLRDQQLAAKISQPSADLIRQYVDLADSYAEKLGPPVLLIVGGLMGTGKSTLAVKLADTLGVESISTDLVRHSMLGPSKVPASYGEGHYLPDMRSRVYEELLRQASEHLKDRQSVVLDGTFLTDGLRTRAYDLGYRYGAETLHVQCTCPRQIAYARIQQRVDTGQSESEARTELHDLQARDYQPLLADDPSITIDTTQPISQQVSVVCAELGRRLFD